MSAKNSSTLDTDYRHISSAFDFPESSYTDKTIGCPTWYMAANKFAHAKPGSFSFNGHQAIFHGYKPGEHFTPRSGKTDKCTTKLSTLPKGTQMCTKLYDKPTPQKVKIESVPVCTIDRQVETDFDDPYSVETNMAEGKSDKMEKDLGNGRKSGKLGKANKKGKKTF